MKCSYYFKCYHTQRGVLFVVYAQGCLCETARQQGVFFRLPSGSITLWTLYRFEVPGSSML